MKEQLFYTKRVRGYQKWKSDKVVKEDFKPLLKQRKTTKTTKNNSNLLKDKIHPGIHTLKDSACTLTEPCQRQKNVNQVKLEKKWIKTGGCDYHKLVGTSEQVSWRKLQRTTEQTFVLRYILTLLARTYGYFQSQYYITKFKKRRKLNT